MSRRRGRGSRLEPGWRDLPAGLALLFVTFCLALVAPDADHHAPDLWVARFVHRDMAFHSVLWLALVWRWPVAAAGVAFGLAAHLLADLFPAAWIGSACPHVPLTGARLCDLGPAWFLVNGAMATILAATCLRRLPAGPLRAAGWWVGPILVVLALQQGGESVFALLVFLPVWALAAAPADLLMRLRRRGGGQ